MMTRASCSSVDIPLVDDRALALVLDVGERELLSEDVRQLVESELYFQGMIAGLIARLLAISFTVLLAPRERIARVPIALRNASLLLVAKAQLRDVDVGNWNRDDVFPLAAEQLASGDVLAQILPNPTANDVAEPGMILVDAQRHPLLPHVAPREDTGDVRENIRRRRLIVAVVLDEPVLDDVDLVLRLLVDDVGDEAR